MAFIIFRIPICHKYLYLFGIHPYVIRSFIHDASMFCRFVLPSSLRSVFGAPSDGTLCRKVPSLANARTSEGTHEARLAREIAVVVVVVVVVVVISTIATNEREEVTKAPVKYIFGGPRIKKSDMRDVTHVRHEPPGKRAERTYMATYTYTTTANDERSPRAKRSAHTTPHNDGRRA